MGPDLRRRKNSAQIQLRKCVLRTCGRHSAGTTSKRRCAPRTGSKRHVARRHRYRVRGGVGSDSPSNGIANSCRCLANAVRAAGWGRIQMFLAHPDPRPSTRQGAQTTRAPSLPLRRTVQWIPPAPSPRCEAAGPMGGRPNWVEAKSERRREWSGFLCDGTHKPSLNAPPTMRASLCSLDGMVT